MAPNVGIIMPELGMTIKDEVSRTATEADILRDC